MVFGLCFAWPQDRKRGACSRKAAGCAGPSGSPEDEFNRRPKYGIGMRFRTLERPSLRTHPLTIRRGKTSERFNDRRHRDIILNPFSTQ
jgi:hypothetical protein